MIIRRFAGTIISYLLLVTTASAQVAPVENWERRMNRNQPPEKIMDAIGLEPGMSIGDIGAGTGRLTVWFAQRVGDKGRVYANDIDKESLDHLEGRIKPRNVENVEIVLGEVKDPCIPDNVLDLAFIINTYHHFSDPIILLRNLTPSFKEEGRLAIVEADPEKLDHASWHSTKKEELLDQVERAGYILERIDAFLKEDNIYIFKVKSNE